MTYPQCTPSCPLHHRLLARAWTREQIHYTCAACHNSPPGKGPGFTHRCRKCGTVFTKHYGTNPPDAELDGMETIFKQKEKKP